MNSQLPLISICVISYNHAHYLPECIGSIFAQTYPNIEIVFCDDASTDNSIEVFEQLIADNARVRTGEIRINRQYRNVNGGLAGAANCYTGLSNFTGEYVCILATDDLLHKEHLSVLYDIISENKTDISATEHVEFLNDDIPAPFNIPDKYTVEIFNTHQAIDIFFFSDNPRNIPFACWHRLYYKKIFNDIKTLPENYFLNSDSAFSIYAFINAETIAQAYGVATFLYRIRDDSASHSSWYKCLNEQTFDSVTKLSYHYRETLSKLADLAEIRNQRVISMIFNAAIDENIPYGQIRRNHRVYIHSDNKRIVTDMLIPYAATFKRRLLRKSFQFTPLLWYMWQKKRRGK
jgi:glycosyltransferase involved in cell wall biosynthesis